MVPFLINDVPLQCIQQASVQYHVPAAIIVSVLKTENGRNGMASKNKNGTYDYGSMQINDVWLRKIAPYGYTKEDIQFNACKNVAVGAWILNQSITKDSNFWHGVGAYHSYTPDKNRDYAMQVEKKYKILLDYIS